MAEGDGDGIAAAHHDADQGLAAVGIAGHAGKSTGCDAGAPGIGNGGPSARRPWWRVRVLAADLALQALLEALDLTGRVDDRLLAREERWQLPHTSTPSSGRVEPTVHSVPHEPQWTLAW